MLFSSLVALALVSPSHAASCDAKALQKQLVDASPQTAADAYMALAACDASAARASAATALPRMIPGDKTSAAAVEAIKAGAGKEVRTWADGLQSDDRGGLLGDLGKACAATPEVQRFFLDTAATLGDDFYTKRWFRSLADCPAPEVQSFLVAQLDAVPARDNTRFNGLLEVVARNLGAGAVPRLHDLLAKTTDDERQTYIISAFSDAAGVGSPNGTNSAAAVAGVKAIVDLSPSFGIKAAGQARTTLVALGDEAASDSMAGVRFKSVKQSDGSFLWGAVVVEDVTCKNGKTQQVQHTGEVRDSGQTWPDQIKAKVDTSATVAWELNAAEKCKGTGTNTVMVSNEPFADDKALRTWVSSQIEIAQKKPADKRVRIDHDPLKI